MGTEPRDRQNDILVESGGSLIGGLAFGFGAGIGLALMATPVGWVGALVIGAGGALTGYAAGRRAKTLYDLSGREIDLVEKLGVSHLCTPGGRGNTGASECHASVWGPLRRRSLYCQ